MANKPLQGTVLRLFTNPNKIAIVSSSEVGRNIAKIGNTDDQFEIIYHSDDCSVDYTSLQISLNGEYASPVNWFLTHKDPMWIITDQMINPECTGVTVLTWEDLLKVKSGESLPHILTADQFVGYCEVSVLMLTDHFFNTSAYQWRNMAKAIQFMIESSWMYWTLSDDQQCRLEKVYKHCSKF